MNILIDVRLCFFIGIIVGVIGAIFISRLGCIKKIKELNTYAKLKGLLIISIVIQSLKVIFHGTVEADRVCMYLKNILSIIDNISLSYIVSFIFYYVVFISEQTRDKRYNDQMIKIINEIIKDKNKLIQDICRRTNTDKYRREVLDSINIDEENDIWKTDIGANNFFLYMDHFVDKNTRRLEALDKYSKDEEYIFDFINKVRGQDWEDCITKMAGNTVDDDEVFNKMDEYIKIVEAVEKKYPPTN
nr:hypothetical protein [uncultured Cellulosilyticum sp.]